MKYITTFASTFLLAGSLNCSAIPSSAGAWPQWRGPDGSGISHEKNLPMDWSSTNRVLWKTPLPGKGRSSPIISGEKVFLTTALEGEVVPGAKPVKHFFNGEDFQHPDSVAGDRKHQLRVLCLDKGSGRILWDKLAYEGTVFDARHKAGSFAAPTPVTDGSRVFAFFGGEGLYAFDFEGKLLWKQSLGGLATLGLGPGSSPVLSGNAVIVQCDQDTGKGSYVAAFDTASGRQIWKTERDISVSWATPILVSDGKRTELITSGSQHIIAYNPATGEELWRCKGLESNAVPSPVKGHSLVFLSTGYPAKRTLAIRPGGEGDITGSDRIVWEYNKGSGYVPSPLLYGEYLYLVTGSGILTCLEAKTGAAHYEGGRLPEPGQFITSPVAYDGHIFLTSDSGDTYVIKAGSTHEVIRKNALGEPVVASMAIADARIFLRGETNLYCIGNSQQR